MVTGGWDSDRASITLPGRLVAKLVVYALVEDYVSYWIHRFVHTEWG
jgi:sterol desaturase/sphingolipid hydroxylase (fatty acid hydroxylase superfamily)